MQTSLLERIDQAFSRFDALSRVINRAADRLMTTKVKAKACHDAGYAYCYSTCGGNCYYGLTPDGSQKICYYREIQWLDRLGYPAPGCESYCYDGCDCYKVIPLNQNCTASCSGCTWA